MNVADAQHLLARLFHFHDARDYQAEVACFATDAVWHRKGKALKGHAEILRVLATRPASLVTMHVVNNVMVDGAGEDVATAAFYLTTYSHDDGTVPAGPVVPHRLPSVGIGHATLSRRGGEWRIAALDTDTWMFSAQRGQ